MTCQKEYRDVYLITVLGEHFALGHFGGPGVKMTPQITCGRALSNEITGTTGVTENLVQKLNNALNQIARKWQKLLNL